MVTVRNTILAVAALVATAPAVQAQVLGGDGYFFEEPNAALTFRGGWALASAGSDVFDFVTSEHTLERGDFSSPALHLDVSLTLAERLDLVLGVGRYRASRESEFRDWVDADDQPILQTTTFTRVPLTAGLKYYVVDRGRSVGSLAWIPQRYLPYFGLGAGWIRHTFRQEGDFVRYTDLSIIPGYLLSEGWSPTAYLAGGLDVALTPRWVVTSEGRYHWGSGDPGQDYEDFQGIDLAGLQATVGLSMRF